MKKTLLDRLTTASIALVALPAAGVVLGIYIAVTELTRESR